MNENPFLNRLDKGHGMAAEKKGAKRFGTKPHAASGALAGLKGDFSLPEFVVESKSTVNDSISLKLDWLRKISGEALEKYKQPALIVQFVDAFGTAVKEGSWVCIPESVFKELISKDSE